ncbi:ATP-dependent DNA helicase Q-like 5 isoform X1 [Amborella trichopoda]|uniref:DNA 3'-5' helicase n=1 Tax=Amborella trichopoda TaxID=13333 RepID=W1PZ81_AMBTC|nr:ATP-dependent DNA helicase Q-like 5 isoform X1 [Amborella trichopoda]ERN13658.1 hypothetical protein AMTR_s00049p00112500 [Amborella trichopoda]|eukprot:XP_006852191.1 ATP-dependent DNA helicase Q-like 5 isoform X1 [Amborella trichopoda]
MDSDSSDSCGSHISATPPSKYSRVRVLSHANIPNTGVVSPSKNSRVRVLSPIKKPTTRVSSLSNNSRTRVPSPSKKSKFRVPCPSKNSRVRASSSKPDAICNPERNPKRKISFNAQTTTEIPFTSPDLLNLDGFSIKVHRPGLQSISASIDNTGIISATHFSPAAGSSRFMKLGLNPAIDDENPVVSASDLKPFTKFKKVPKFHPNLISSSVISPKKVVKRCSDSGNFVKLNINGGGKFSFKGKRRFSRKSDRKTWKRRRKEDKDDGVFEQEVLQSNGDVDFNGELVNEILSTVRENPSDENLVSLLKLIHGFDGFREWQLEAIKRVLKRESVMLVQPTGSGKSLCYQLPALILPGVTLVVSPLIALMVDQLHQLPPAIPGGLLSSNQNSKEASEVLDKLCSGHLKVLFVSPERFLNDVFVSIFHNLPPISLVVIDEAHCLSEWSHNFRPSYLRLRASILRSKLNVECILAMTATATVRTLRSITDSLDISPINLIQASHVRENLQLSVTFSGNRLKDLLKLIKSSPFADLQSIIVYCKFQFETDMVSKFLCDNNILAKSYHSGIPTKDRNRVQELFCSNKIKVVVATVAFGMGLNKSDVGAVIHYSLPESLEEYVQETGRAGRDGRLAYCHLLMDDSTYTKLCSLSYSDGVDDYAVNKFLCLVFKDYNENSAKVCSFIIEPTTKKFDMKEEVMITILTYLDIGEVQYLRMLPQLNATCTLCFHKTSSSLLSRKHIIISGILKIAKATQGQYVFDVPTLAKTVGFSIDDLMRQLQELQSMGEVTYELKDPALCYMVMKVPEDYCSLATNISKWLGEVEKCKVWKLNTMYNIGSFAAKLCKKTEGCSDTLHTPCLQRMILGYFTCDSESQHDEFPNKAQQSSRFLRADIKVFLQSNSHAKFTPRSVARILHGISSPAFPLATWSKNHFWGRYSEIDFIAVKEAAAAELMTFVGKASM